MEHQFNDNPKNETKPESDDDALASRERSFVSLVLQEAIRSTLENQEPDSDGIQDELHELAGIRSKYQGSLDADTELTEMVQAVLKRHLGRLFTGEAQLQSVAGQIAMTLFDDLAVRRRLESFRDRLKASTE